MTVDVPQNYTFALFGKDNAIGIEEDPIVSIKCSETAKDPGKCYFIVVYCPFVCCTT